MTFQMCIIVVLLDLLHEDERFHLLHTIVELTRALAPVHHLPSDFDLTTNQITKARDPAPL
jgi:hypothetical protein